MRMMLKMVVRRTPGTTRSRTAVRAKRRQKRPCQLEHAEEVGLHHPPNFVLRHILQSTDDRGAGIMHDRIERRCR
jgi:hypothetical protein